MRFARIYQGAIHGIFIYLMASLAGLARADNPDQERIHAQVKAYWDSIETLEASGEEFILDSDGRRVFPPGSTSVAIWLAYGSGGRYAFQRRSRGKDGSVAELHQFREDGRTFYGLVSTPEEPDVIDDVVIRNQVDLPGEYDNTMCLALWAWMPGGKPVHKWIEEGGSVTREQVGGREQFTLTATRRGNRLRCVLDPGRNWLPAQVELEGVFVCKTTSFERSAGHWFPSEIVWAQEAASLPPGSNTHSAFKLSQVSVNSPTTSTVFRMPPITDGTLVRDERNWSSYIKGGNDGKHGNEARKNRFELRKARVAALNPASEKLDRSMVLAEATVDRFRWELVFLAGAFVCLGTWGWMRRTA